MTVYNCKNCTTKQHVGIKKYSSNKYKTTATCYGCNSSWLVCFKCNRRWNSNNVSKARQHFLKLHHVGIQDTNKFCSTINTKNNSSDINVSDTNATIDLQ